MAACFAVAAVASIDRLQSERFALFMAGLSPVDWGQMTSWQRRDLLLRHRDYVKREVAEIKKASAGDKKSGKGLSAIIGLIAKRLMGA